MEIKPPGHEFKSSLGQSPGRSTVALETIFYNDYAPIYYPLINFSSLLKAHIDIGPSEEQLEEEEEDETSQYGQNVSKLVAACSNVGFMYLSNSSVSAISCAHLRVPTFYNLTELFLGDINGHGWALLPHLLESAPNLEILAFMEGFSEYTGCYAKFQNSLQHCVPTCVSSRIRDIFFEEFNGEGDEFDLVEYFLKTGQVMTKMEFSFSSSLPLEKQYSTWTKLLLMQKGTKTCRVEFRKEVTVNVVTFCLLELFLGDINGHGWALLPHLLESAPNLEILAFMEGFSEYTGCYAKFQNSLQHCVPTCVSSRIRDIFFEEFNGEGDEFDLVEYFLKTGQVMTKMEFSFSSSLPLEKQYSTWTKLLLMQKGTKTCRVEFRKEVTVNVVTFCLLGDENESQPRD
ncbi:hypothetical protein TEA_018419 [Camellia sinensis var. sinensis]|uniref:FBD domain-containing protein n=2 Tax=Camellia sinensis TaxID=4442 RepID=A0A4S4CZD3_CAMSN|nr:hypothetical protein TEA_018419 [Camellia sinensis var. sinensis]